MDPGSCQTACGKEYFECKEGEPEVIELVYPGISYFLEESANSFLPLLVILYSSSYAGSAKEEYELEERCGKLASEEFQKEFGNGLQRDKEQTVWWNYTNHYNRKLDFVPSLRDGLCPLVSGLNRAQ